jgi:hypothetical protein
MASGYVHCQCPECFEIAIADETDVITLCHECEAAGCDGKDSCQCEHECEEETEGESNTMANGEERSAKGSKP